MANKPSYGKNAKILVHGGAGAVSKKRMTETREKNCKAKLEQALKAGAKVIDKGGPALDAVIAAIKVLEDSSLFNAGKGSVLTRAGKVEMDAAVMNGADLTTGAVCGITRVKNPVTAARAVMELTPHVLLMGTGADHYFDEIAKDAGLKIMPPDYFVTQRSIRGLKRYLDREKLAGKEEKVVSGLSTGASQGEGAPPDLCDPFDGKYGTVGSVALDKHGNLAAATSTGGITAQSVSRIGDSPIVGAGTYANNKTCAVSCTGHGEHFIRACAAHEISSLIKHKKVDVQTAADQVVFNDLKITGGEGGVIVIDSKGNFAMPYNTMAMFRGVATKNGRYKVAIF